MSLQIQKDNTDNTTTKEFSLQTFNLPFQSEEPTGYSSPANDLAPCLEFILPQERSARLPRNPQFHGFIDGTTAAFEQLFSLDVNLLSIFKWLRGVETETKAYGAFSANVMLRLEVVGAANYQGLIGYTVTSGFLNDEYQYRHPIGVFENENLMDTSLQRRFFQQSPTLIPLSRASYMDIPIPITFPLDKLPTPPATGIAPSLLSYPMSTVTLYNIVPMKTVSAQNKVYWSARFYLTDVSFDTPRLPPN